MLGAMAYCAPRQLGACLPQVVPRLTDAMGDSHVKVREAGKLALHDVGRVVKNPEIAKISPVLLAALEDPNGKTEEALNTLQRMSFVHSIDAPSLALIVPVLNRGLKATDGDAKKSAALIVGNMCSMIHDPKDILPYLSSILPCLQKLLMDPTPEVRAGTAKAMGMLVTGVGEEHFPDIVPWLVESVMKESTSVERSGSAQGLCEVLVALGTNRVTETLTGQLFPLHAHPQYYVREGICWTIAFLSPALGKGFAPYIEETMPIIIAGLADETEAVREVAMHAGQVVVHGHALTETDLLLPQLEGSLFDQDWRIRQSAVTLLGDLLYRIGGTRAVGLAENDDDEGAGSAAADVAITKLLGLPKRNDILSALYMIRSDLSSTVRQAALQVWKSVVSNTPRTLREMLPTLMTLLVQHLSSDFRENRTVAGRCVGEIVTKLGDRVLPEILPILQNGLQPQNTISMRQGVLLGLSAVIAQASKALMEGHFDLLIVCIRDGLCDAHDSVRESAANTFAQFQKSVGSTAVAEMAPYLLEAASSKDADTSARAMKGLQQILAAGSKGVLPYVVPKLLALPLTLPNLHSLASVAQVTGETIHYHLVKILQALFDAILSARESNDLAFEEQAKVECTTILLSVQTVGVQWLMVELQKYCVHEQAPYRELGLWGIAAFCSSTEADYEAQVPVFLKCIAQRLNDSCDTQVPAMSLAALRAMNKTCTPEELSYHLDFFRNIINSLVSDTRHRKGGVGTGEFYLEALTIAKGLEPFLPAYQWSLMNGNAELRDVAASGLGELILLTPTPLLKPFLIKITGPLIRIVGDRFPGHVKASILSTLTILLKKGGVSLKPFLPQLQTTFVKSLSDPMNAVRGKGCEALTQLVQMSTRIDPLILDLCDKVTSSSDGGVRISNLQALCSVLSFVVEKVSDASLNVIGECLLDMLSHNDEKTRVLASKTLSSILNLDTPKEFRSILDFALPHMQAVSEETWAVRHGHALALLAVSSSSRKVHVANNAPQALALIQTYIQEDIASLQVTAVECLGPLGSASPTHLPECIAEVMTLLDADGVQKDVRTAALSVITVMCKSQVELMRTQAASMIPSILGHIKSSAPSVKAAADRSLYVLCELSSRPATLSTLTKSLDAATSKLLSEHVRRVLSKLKPENGV